MPSAASRDRARAAVDAAREGVREAMDRLAGLFGPRPALVPIPVRVSTPAQRRRAALEALRDQGR